MSKTSNLVVSAFCGIFFAAGWWFFIDGVAYASQKGHPTAGLEIYLPGILATFGLFLINNLPNELFSSDAGFWGSEEIEWYHKALVVLSVMLNLASMIMSVWVYFGKKFHTNPSFEIKWRAQTSIIQSGLISLASFLWRFGWKKPDTY